jgi:hypothetical protein
MADAGSTTPQLRKLGIVPGARWSVIGADAGWHFETAPDTAAEVASTASADVVLVFVRAAAELEPALVQQEQRVFPSGALWIAWPRKAAGHVSDLGDSVVRDAALAHRLVDVKVAALDYDWSALKLVWRAEARS